MKNKTLLLLAMVVVLASSGAFAGEKAKTTPEIAGIIGMTPITESSYAAVWIPVGKGEALSGLLWYNNDGGMVFPEVLLASGAADQPALVSNCYLGGENVGGQSSAWSEMQFTEPAASSRGGFYVIIRFPVDGEQVGIGAGGGAGIGYFADGGCTGWLSADGEDWVKVGRSYGFAVIPQMVPAEDWMLEKSGGLHDPQDGKADYVAPETFVTELLPAYPNPFNPNTDVSFTLKSAGRVEIKIYDIRGSHVIDLVDDSFEAGAHQVRWEGLNRSGRQVASGTYLVHMRTGEGQETRRVMLVK